MPGIRHLLLLVVSLALVHCASADVRTAQTVVMGLEADVDAVSLVEFVNLYRQQRTYSITGLPEGSGLSLDVYTGIIHGVPNAVDLSNTPIEVTIFTDDEDGHLSIGTFQLSVSECGTTDDCQGWGFCQGQLYVCMYACM